MIARGAGLGKAVEIDENVAFLDPRAFTHAGLEMIDPGAAGTAERHDFALGLKPPKRGDGAGLTIVSAGGGAFEQAADAVTSAASAPAQTNGAECSPTRAEESGVSRLPRKDGYISPIARCRSASAVNDASTARR